MVAGLVKTPVRNIRRWYRMGLLTSAKVAHRLPYFQFVQVQNARQLVNWIGRGAHPSDIKRQLVDFSIWVENRSFMELDLVVDGRRLLLRHGDQLLGANGQLHLDFDRTEAFDAPESSRTPPVTATIPFQSESHPANSNANDVQNWTREEMLQAAEELEDDGRLEQSIGWYRIILARYGMTAEICFQLAELLYRTGDVSAARERYYNAIELDEDFIEARANLGCVLAETGQTILAVAAFQGALSRDDSYPDVHYHLAKCLDVTIRTVNYWESGKNPIPSSVIEFMISYEDELNDRFKYLSLHIRMMMQKNIKSDFESKIIIYRLSNSDLRLEV
jgi:tetratricopeptide (TPR) repeat protein